MASDRPYHLHFVQGAPGRATSTSARPEKRKTALREEWDALADRVGAPPFVRPGWIDAWHASYGAGELQLLTVRDRAERLIGVLPLDVTPKLTSSSTNTHSPLFGPVVAGAQAARLLALELLERTPRRLRLDHLDPESTWFAALEETLREARWHVLLATLARSPYVRTGGDWDAYRKTLSKNLVKQIARRRRRLEENGALAVAVHATGEGLDSALEDFVALEASGWKAGQGTAIASRAESVGFYAQVASWAAERDWLRIAFLRHDGRPIASEFALECDGVMYSLKGGFDPEFRRFGPGQLLTFESLARAFAGDIGFYELLGSDDDYKLSWTDQTRERVRLHAFPPGLRGAARYRVQRHVRPTWARLRRR